MTDTLKVTETNGIAMEAGPADEDIEEAGVSFIHSEHEEPAVSEEGVSRFVEVKLDLVRSRYLLTPQHNPFSINLE